MILEENEDQVEEDEENLLRVKYSTVMNEDLVVVDDENE